MNNDSTLATTIGSNGKLYVEYPALLRESMAETMRLWEVFCALPDEVKLKLPYDPDSAQSGNGYELKRESGGVLDRKENFHFRLDAREELLGHARASGIQEAIALTESALALPTLIEPILLDFAKNVEKQYSIPGFADDVAATIPNLIIRLLHYFGDTEPGAVIAAPHIDKGGFTLHLYESDEGVEQLLPTGEWKSIPVSHKETVLFPALGLQYLLQNQLKALCHRVVATEASAKNGRYSAVAFVDFRSYVHYDKKKHGRLQNWPPGFNYTMPWEELKTLFVET